MKIKTKNIPLPIAVLLTIGCLLMGSVFTFGMSYWNADVEKDSCVNIDTTFVSYNEIKNIKQPGRIKEIEIGCSDGNKYYIDGSCVTKEIRNKLNAISIGSKLNLILHPNSINTVLELSVDNVVLVSFDETTDNLGIEKDLFLSLGILIYFVSLLAIFSVIKKLKINEKMRRYIPIEVIASVGFFLCFHTQ